MSQLRVVILCIGIIEIAGCSGRLTTDKASAEVRRDQRILTTDSVLIEDISQSQGRAEAIARATVNDVPLLLHLRRYDSGWRWEGAELLGHSLSPEEALRETRNRKWRKEFGQQVDETLSTLDGFCGIRGWAIVRGSLDIDKWVTGYLTFVKGEWPTDSWKRNVRVQGDSYGATFRSDGADGKENTADDLICKARQVPDLLRSDMFPRKWILPDAAAELVRPYLKARDSVEASDKLH